MSLLVAPKYVYDPQTLNMKQQ